MADRELKDVLKKLHSARSYQESTALLSKAKILLLKLNALTPTPQTPKSVLAAARDVFEAGALISIRNRNSEGFTRYTSQLQPFYELPEDVLPAGSERNRVTGLSLLLLLVKGDYAGFHTELEGLENIGKSDVETDKFLGYPVKLERWLMEGSYDKVWKALDGPVPSEEYGVFSEILIPRIRAEIASCSERAYPSLPVSSTKTLLFFDSDQAVVQFAKQRGWEVKADGRIYFDAVDGGAIDEVEEAKELSHIAIENTLGYARELEMIV